MTARVMSSTLASERRGRSYSCGFRSICFVVWSTEAGDVHRSRSHSLRALNHGPPVASVVSNSAPSWLMVAVTALSAEAPRVTRIGHSINSLVPSIAVSVRGIRTRLHPQRIFPGRPAAPTDETKATEGKFFLSFATPWGGPFFLLLAYLWTRDPDEFRFELFVRK